MARVNSYFQQLPGKTDRVQITAIDWQHVTQTKITKGRIVQFWDNIALLQTGKKTFAVVYGLSIMGSLSYESAAIQLGYSLMHQQACEGRIDGRD